MTLLPQTPASASDIAMVRDQRHRLQSLASTEDGVYLIAWLLNEARYFSMDPAQIIPEKIAMANTLLHDLGIYHYTNVKKVAAALVGVANEDDLKEQERRLQGVENA